MLVQSGALKLFIFTDVNFWSPEKVNSVKPLIVVLLRSIVSKLDHEAKAHWLLLYFIVVSLIFRFFKFDGKSDKYKLEFILKPWMSKFSILDVENIAPVSTTLDTSKLLKSAVIKLVALYKKQIILVALEVSNWAKSKLEIVEWSKK